MKHVRKALRTASTASASSTTSMKHARKALHTASTASASGTTVPLASASAASLPLTYETHIYETTPHALVCGVDEAGRGPLAGPVVACACVLLPPTLGLPAALPAGVTDSKAVGEEEREALFPELLSCPRLAFGVSVLDHAAIDRVNIFAASMLAMERAVAAARQAACARLGLPSPPRSPGLPKEDAIDFAAAAAVQPTPLAASQLPPALHPLGALHTVFVDGPHCPPRIAAATDGGVYEISLSSSSSSSSGSKPSKKRGRMAEEDSPAALPAAAVPGRKPVTVVAPAVDEALQGRLGPVHTARPIIGGDSKVFTIAAASLVAKVTRDRLMRAHAAQWPQYGFEAHKGYGTSSHMAAIAKHGACPIHRLTFAPLKHMYPAAAAEAAGKPAPVAAAATAAAAAPATSSKRARK